MFVLAEHSVKVSAHSAVEVQLSPNCITEINITGEKAAYNIRTVENAINVTNVFKLKKSCTNQTRESDREKFRNNVFFLLH